MIDIFAVFFGVILTFLIVVVIHELGHFFAARLMGVKPEIFSVGFGKPIWSRKYRQGIVRQVSLVLAGGAGAVTNRHSRDITHSAAD